MKNKATAELDSRLLMEDILEMTDNMPLMRLSREIETVTGKNIHRVQLRRLRDSRVSMMHSTAMALVTFKQKYKKKAPKDDKPTTGV